MSYLTTIKEGIHTVHKNWQLIIVQFISTVLSFIGFFVIVGVPIAIAFIIFGLDLTEILRFKDIASAFKGSAELLQKYFVVAILVMLSIFLYAAFIVFLWTFTISGTIGILKNAIINPNHKFSAKIFLSEGKIFFLPVFLFSVIIVIAFVAIAFMLGLLGGASAEITEMAKAQEATLALFLGVFFSLFILSVGMFLIIAMLSITIYGIAHLAFARLKPIEAVKEAIRYIYLRPSAIGFYAFVFFGYIAALFLVILIGAPFALIPLIGPILSIPYQIITSVAQVYLSLIMLSSIFHYYYKTRYSLPSPESIEDSGIFQTVEKGQVPAPQRTDESQQV